MGPQEGEGSNPFPCPNPDQGFLASVWPSREAPNRKEEEKDVSIPPRIADSPIQPPLGEVNY